MTGRVSTIFVALWLDRGASLPRAKILGSGPEDDVIGCSSNPQIPKPSELMRGATLVFALAGLTSYPTRRQYHGWHLQPAFPAGPDPGG